MFLVPKETSNFAFFIYRISAIIFNCKIVMKFPYDTVVRALEISLDRYGKYIYS